MQRMRHHALALGKEELPQTRKGRQQSEIPPVGYSEDFR